MLFSTVQTLVDDRDLDFYRNIVALLDWTMNILIVCVYTRMLNLYDAIAVLQLFWITTACTWCYIKCRMGITKIGSFQNGRLVSTVPLAEFTTNYGIDRVSYLYFFHRFHAVNSIVSVASSVILAATFYFYFT